MQITPARSVRHAPIRSEYGPWHDPPDSAPGAFYLPVRRFPPPGSVEDIDAAFVVKDGSGQKVAYVFTLGRLPPLPQFIVVIIVVVTQR
jgi:hypothetical protein